MKIISKYFRGRHLVIMLIVFLVYVGSSMCTAKSNEEKDKMVYGPNDRYIGSQTCITCYRKIYDSLLIVAHKDADTIYQTAYSNDRIVAKR